MAEKLGRKLLRTEHVHHKDHNNLPENLEILDPSEHLKLHHREEPRVWSEEMKERMRESARKRCTPEWKVAVSRRVTEQYAAGKFGRKTWKSA
jgi:hypothetical protein